MARYIDADKLLNDLCTVSAPTPSESWVVEKCIDKVNEQLTADVVPKSEVERLVDKWIGEENLTQDAMVLRLIEALRDEAKRYERYYFNHEYDKIIAEAKQDCAREIFEDIEKEIDFLMAEILKVLYAKGSRANGKTVLLSKYNLLIEAKDFIAELKKKYPKSEDKE